MEREVIFQPPLIQLACAASSTVLPFKAQKLNVVGAGFPMNRMSNWLQVTAGPET